MGRGDNRRTIKMQRRAGQRRKKRRLKVARPVTGKATAIKATPSSTKGE